MQNIPFNKPSLVGKELEYIAAALEAGHISGDGIFSKQCQALLEQELQIPKALLTTSCTHALEMMALLLDLKAPDEVIFPDFTFVSTINAFVLRGVRPVFVDIRPDTLNIDERLIEAAITPRTKALMVVHYAGVGCEMDAIAQIAHRHNLVLLEDNAHGLFGKYRGEWLGKWGAMTSLSFHETKNFTCGEGGALLINDPGLIERAEIIREKGTNRSRFFRGQVDKYSWVDVGSSYLPSDLLAAFLYGQLEARATIQTQRQRVWHYYFEHLQDWAQTQAVQFPQIPAHCQQPCHMFYMLMPSLDARQSFIAQLKAQGILSVFHYLPLHLSEMGQKFGGRLGDCPVTEEMSDRIVRLPFYSGLTEADLSRITEHIRMFKC